MRLYHHVNQVVFMNLHWLTNLEMRLRLLIYFGDLIVNIYDTKLIHKQNKILLEFQFKVLNVNQQQIQLMFHHHLIPWSHHLYVLVLMMYELKYLRKYFYFH